MQETALPEKKRRGYSFQAVAAVAVVFVAVGILIASSLDFSPELVADVNHNVGQSGGYPVVQVADREYQSPFVAVVERVKDAVVNISARTRKSSDMPWWHQGPDFKSSSGSGFFFREDGYIVTNNHVVQNADKVTVRTSSGYEYDARVVGTDPETDLAVLKIEPEEDITWIEFGNSDDLRVGDWAIAIGNPFPQQGLDRTVTVGVISAKGRSNLRFGRETPSYQYYIQTDASINPGNSGGPLLNLKGEAIGINAAISSPTGTSVGIGFAIPINLARAIVPDLISSGRASRGWLGVQLSTVSEKEAKRLGLHAVKGVHIDSVFSNSPAHRAGMIEGDVIVGFNNKEVVNASQLMVLVSTVKSGTEVPIEIIRDGKRRTLKTTLADRETFLAGLDNNTPVFNNRGGDDKTTSLFGMELVEFTTDIARALSIKHVDGLYVKRVRSGSPADNASITKGTIVLDIDNQPIKSLADVSKLQSGRSSGNSTVPVIVQEPDGTITRKVIRP